MSSRFNIYLKEEELINHLEKQENKSAYIADLIRKDINKESTVDYERVKSILVEVLKDYSLDKRKEEMLSKEIKNSISNIIDFD